MSATAPRPPATRRLNKVGRSRHLTWLFILPAVIPYLLFVLIPSAQGVVLSFTDWNLLNPEIEFLGFENYIEFFHDPQALTAFANTLFFVVVGIILENVIGLLLALGINAKVKSRAVLRLIYFIPVLMVTVVVGFVWRFILQSDGPFNQLLSLFGFGEVTTAWLGSPTSALWWIAIMTAWQFSGYTMVIYLAGLQEVPPTQLEAAALDGAGPVRTFWSIVRPLLGPAFTINLVLSTIRGLMIFDMIWVTTQGGPANTTNSLGTLIFRDAFQFQQFGYSLAAAVILSLLVAIASVAQYLLTNRQKKS